MINSEHRRAVTNAMRALARAKAKALRAVEAAFPIGTEVQYEVRGHTQIGQVLAHSDARDCDRIRVVNITTGNDYWIWIGDVRGYHNAARAKFGE